MSRPSKRRGAGKKPPPAESRPRGAPTPFYLLLGLIAIAGAGWLLYEMFGGEEAATEPVPVAIDPAELSRVEGIALGREDAPVVIYEFADFQCPACGQYAALITPLIKERLVEPGTVRYVHYDFPLVNAHPNAFLAARAARCADEQGGFWPFSDVVYARQPSWSGEGNPTDLFVEYAETVGLNASEFEQCLRSDRYAEEVTRSLRLGESLGVQGTPTFFINGKRLPTPPTFQELERLVAEETGATPAAPGAEESAAVPEADGRPGAGG